MLTRAQQLYLGAYYYRRWLIAGVAFLIGYWMLRPEPGAIILPQCEPDGALATISERVHGVAFWRVQLPYIRRQISTELNWDSYQQEARAKERAALDIANAGLEKMYVQHPELAPSPAQRRAEQLRALADAVEDAENSAIVSDYMRKQAAGAQACEAKILDMR